MGELTVASCVVFGSEGPLKSDYRRFNLEGLTPGDDYGGMHQALTRRYARIKRGEVAMPDVLLIDGGKGQLAQAQSVLQELDIRDVVLVGVAKGADRRAGQERLFLVNSDAPLILAADSPALHVIQRIRDEAHRLLLLATASAAPRLGVNRARGYSGLVRSVANYCANRRLAGIATPASKIDAWHGSAISLRKHLETLHPLTRT